MIRVKDLPVSDRTYTPVKGGIRVGRPVFLFCQVCGAHYSATRGDYFARDPDQVLTCCNKLMILAQTHTTITEIPSEVQ